MSGQFDRRDFLKLTAGLGAGMALGCHATPAPVQSHTGLSDPSYRPPTGPATAVGLTSKPLDMVRVGIIGLGMRGPGLLKNLLNIEGMQVLAVCDVRPEATASGAEQVAKAGQPRPQEYSGSLVVFKDMCQRPDLDLIVIATPWEWHAPMAQFAMECGKHAAVEVPGAMSIEDCWKLVETSERTRCHCMMLENCCYGYGELTALMMCRAGLLGELLHGEGAYLHDLRELKMTGYYEYWRLKWSQKYDGNLYPTHGLGPVAQYMGINRGDQFASMSSISSKSLSLKKYAIEHFGPDDWRSRADYKLGDMNTTIIRTQLGRSIMVQHDTTSPRPYSRLNLISGTGGIYADYPTRLALAPEAHKWLSDDQLKARIAQHQHPLWNKVGDIARKVGGHGGMDYIMMWRLIDCLRRGDEPDMDVYDLAAWCSVVELSIRSVAKRGESVDMIDFTRGAWRNRQPLGIVS
ncbi:MAG: Gfo/Idh/MocA family oxidoreductase [Phycisphaeraceae bacterium]|nr:Gfo/Idh/MocA family oxidoreductase [Phycisphaeraceae bacterium]